MTSPVDRKISLGKSDGRSHTTTVITEAELPYDTQVRNRRRRYLLTMSMRIPLLLAAVACYQIPWLAVLILAISIPLPWVAVLMANDRPAQKARKVVPGTINHERALPAPVRDVIDSE